MKTDIITGGLTHFIKATTILVAFCLTVRGAFGQDSDKSVAPSQITPEELSEIVECGSDDDEFFRVGELFFSRRELPDWMSRDETEEEIMGMETFRLARPITILGSPADHISFYKEWVVVEQSRKLALETIEAYEMKRAPMKLVEQYYRFVDPETGPMLGAFPPPGNSLALMLGIKSNSRVADSFFVGCNYAGVSELDFLSAAREADAIMSGAGNDIKRMMTKDRH